MTVSTIFNKLVDELADPIIRTMALYAQDQDEKKVDVSIGVYKSETGGSFTFPSVVQAKEVIRANDPGHNYTNMQGIPEFRAGAQRVVFGDETNGNIASLQTISGTGALHMAILVLKAAGYQNYYVGTPTWSNYVPMIEHIDGKINTYRYYNETTKEIDFDALVNALSTAPEYSIFLLQACCHNPTGADLTQEQWIKVIDLMKQRNLIPLLDMAYQGFSSGNKDTDAWAARYLYKQDIDFLVCQSFAKNLGLYGERVGCLHVVVKDKDYMPNAVSTLVALFRHECSFAPAFGARVASTIFQNPELHAVWDKDVADITNRLKSVRQQVYDRLVKLGTPGKWDHVIKQTGLFWFSGLTPVQNQRLLDEFHIYSTGVGRVNVAGLNNGNIDYVCKAIDHIVRSS
jgi:aspartate aminotransferase